LYVCVLGPGYLVMAGALFSFMGGAIKQSVQNCSDCLLRLTQPANQGLS